MIDPLFDDSKAPIRAGRSKQVREGEDAVSERQRRTLGLIAQAGPIGMTWVDLSHKTGWHHGQTSVLSDLHREGGIARLLSGKRARSSVYVLPEHVNGRGTAEYGGRKPFEVDSRLEMVAEQIDASWKRGYEEGRAAMENKVVKPNAITPAQDDLVEAVRTALGRFHDKPTITIRVATASELVKIIDTLAGR